MKKKDVEVGATYAVKVGGRISPVKLIRPAVGKGWIGINTRTNRTIRVLSAARLRYKVISDVDRQLLGGKQ